MLANYAGDGGISYPSIETLSKATALTDDTVRSALKSLESQELIKDTGKKAGATQQIRVFRLPIATWSEASKPPNQSEVKPPRNPRETPEEPPNPPARLYKGTGTGTGTISLSGKPPRKPTFAPPSIEESFEYGKTIEMSEEHCKAWMDHFVSNGWVVGKARAPMKDFRASMRTWKRNILEFSSNGHVNGRARTESFFELNKKLEAKKTRMIELKRRHYSETQSVIGGKYLPPGWRDTKAKEEYFRLKTETEIINQQLSKA